MNTLSPLVSFSLRILLLLFMVSACSSSPEKEIKNWKNNIIDLQDSIRMYPNLKGALTANLNQSSLLWKKAQSIGDPNLQLEAMKKANASARKLVKVLRQIESKLDTVQRRVNTLSRLPLKGNLIMKRERALQGLDRSLQQVRNTLTKTPMNDPLQAHSFLIKQAGLTTNVWRRSDSVLKQFKKLKRSQSQGINTRLKQKGKTLMNKSRQDAMKGTLKPVTKPNLKRPMKPPMNRPMPKRRAPSRKTKRPSK